jgi:hypothetical protein
MSNCTYCGKPAGFLRRVHLECEQRHDAGKRQILSFISLGIAPSNTSVVDQIKEIAKRSFIGEEERHELEVQAWTSAVDNCLQDNVLDEAGERQLIEWKDQLSLSQDESDRNKSYARIVQNAVIREVLSGVIPADFDFDGDLHINLQRGEQVVWVFENVRYFEDRPHREFVGRSEGISIRVMSGLYYRIGSFRGHAITSTETVYVDTGVMAITNKNLYFEGPSKPFRVPYRKIVSFSPYEDGIGIIRDAASAKPQIFVNDEGWFTYNLVTNLARLDAQ